MPAELQGSTRVHQRRPLRKNVVPHAAVVKSSTARSDLTTATCGTVWEMCATADGARRLWPLELSLPPTGRRRVEPRLMRLQHETIDHRRGHVEHAAVRGFL
jgi:hypothetical protein